jgi:DNA-binding CsgD family transcriptional regulator/PAS domain-containing protein
LADAERDLADCVGAIYEAAANGGSWLDVGQRICRLMDAQRATLRIGHGSSEAPNVLMPPDESEVLYTARFHALNPFMARARRDFADAREHHLRRAMVGSDIMPDSVLLRSEYYGDFARHYERRHMIGGMVGITHATPVAVFRGEGTAPFAQRELDLLLYLLPHVQSALELRARLAHDVQSVWLTRAALDALPSGVGVVDAGLKIRFVNEVAGKYLAGPDAGLFSLRSGPYVGGDLYLAALSRDEAAMLRRLVRSATTGGPGGSMRVRSPDGSAVALLVTPVPQGLLQDLAAANPAASTIEPLAMVLIRPIIRRAAPPPAMLCELYGLTPAEAAVAVALVGGATAEQVASQRGVSLMTVRVQIRSVLGKSGCTNLRELEHTLATLAAHVPQRWVAAAPPAAPGNF